MNEKRRGAAIQALEAHLKFKKEPLREEEEEALIVDLIVDLLHLACFDEFDTAGIIRMASTNFEAEILEVKSIKLIKDVELTLLNYYACTNCGHAWDDGWTCACDDDCPQCGTSMTPYFSEDFVAE